MATYLQTNQIVILPYVNSTISVIDTGKVFITPQTAGAVDVVYTLPAPSAGLHYRFINGAPAALSGSVQINTNVAAAILYGQLITGPTDGVALQAIAGSTQIRFLTAVSLLSDVIDLYSDGTSWFVNAVSQVAGGITLSP